MKRFIKKDIMNSADSAVKLTKVDPLDTNSHRNYSNVDLGFAAEQELSKLKKHNPNPVIERQVMQVKLECKESLAKMSSKLIDKCCKRSDARLT